MLHYLKEESNMTFTENGAVTHQTTMSDCLDLFAVIGAIRGASESKIIDCFRKAYAENPDTAMKILFFGRDVRGGLGERRAFRIIVNWLAKNEPTSIRKNIALISEYGRYDDLLALLDTDCEEEALRMIDVQLKKDMESENVSLLAKWLPSINASNKKTIAMGKRIARHLRMSDAQYRKVLVGLRKKICIIENNLREKEYSFDYSKQPSKAMFKYRKAFIRNDQERYQSFLEQVKNGTAKINTGTLMPYDIIAPCLIDWRINSCLGRWQKSAQLTPAEREGMDVTWNALENFGGDENALVVIDGSGSMYSGHSVMPITVALSLGIYFAERNTGKFQNHFITFSQKPQLVEIKGKDIVEKVQYCARYNEIANTNLQAVFELILNTAIKYSVPQEEMPEKIYIISDMEFDYCINNAELTNFAYAKKIFEEHGYRLPDVVFWNVNCRNMHQPVTQNEKGIALVSGCTPRLFSMVAGGIVSPYATMMDIVNSARYSPISA